MEVLPSPSNIVQSIPHSERRGHDSKESKYFLPTDQQEQFRLKLQHDVLKVAFGNKLVQSPIDVDKLGHVLEVGAGTGIWLAELAAIVPPSTLLQAIDIETSMFPEDMPSNVTIATHNVTQLPSDWAGRFDLVHQRLLVAALLKSEWPTALSELYRVLRPGGWVEVGEPSYLFGVPAMRGAQAKYTELMQRLFLHKGMLLNCSIHIPVLLEQIGFRNISVERRLLPLGKLSGKLGVDHSIIVGEVYRGMKGSIMRAGGFSIVHSEEEFDKLMDDVEEEWNTIPGSGMYHYVITAQKPSA